MNTPDITQHPLWRPHHGDMTGWRYLEIDEEIISGDECFERALSYSGWRETFQPNQGYTPQSFPHNDYRRRITQQEEPKRFVTVVYEFHPDDTTLTLANLSKEIGLKIETIREGNALAQLDQWDDDLQRFINERRGK